MVCQQHHHNDREKQGRKTNHKNAHNLPYSPGRILPWNRGQWLRANDLRRLDPIRDRRNKARILQVRHRRPALEFTRKLKRVQT